MTPFVHISGKSDEIGRLLAIRIAWICLALTTTLAALSLTGWILQLDSLKAIIPNHAPMSFMTSVALLCLCASLGLQMTKRGSRQTWLWTGLASAAACIALIRLYIAAYESNTGLFGRPVNAGLDEMNLLTAIALLAGAIAVLLLEFRTRGGDWPSQWAALSVGIIATLALMNELFRIGRWSPNVDDEVMALISAIAFVPFTLAVLCARPDRGIIAILLARDDNAVLARRQFAGVLVIPPLVGAARLLGEQQGYYALEFGVALTTVAMMTAMGLLVAISLESLHRARQRRLEIELALQESQERLNRAINGSSDGLWEYNPSSNEIWYSPRTKAMLGYDESDDFPNLLQTFHDHLHPDDLARVDAAIQSHVVHSTPYDIEFRLRTKGGDYRWFRSRGDSVRDSNQRSIHMSGSTQDITSLKMAEAELQQTAIELGRSNKDLEEFAYVASHDLRAPLRAIKNLVEWLREDLANSLDGENLNRMELLLGRVHRMDHLIEDLLQYSRAGRMLGRIQNTNVSALVDDIVDLLNPPPGFEVIKIGEMPTFETAVAPLEQIVRNLIGNSIKHHDKPAGRIEVEVCEAGEFYEFIVRDDGPGIEPQFHERVFRLFETLQPRDQVEGSGMGLAVVKRTVEQLGGVIQLESEPGKGSTFRFTWPQILPGRKSETLPENAAATPAPAEAIA